MVTGLRSLQARNGFPRPAVVAWFFTAATQALVGVAALTTQVAAHPLQISTARLTLRDGHFEVHAEWDALPLITDTPTAIATMDDAALADVHKRWLAALLATSKLEADGVALPLRWVLAPEPSELRAIAASLSAAGHDHGALVPLRFESQPLPAMPRTVRWRSPAAVGPVLVTLVEPVTRLVAPGTAAQFLVLPAPVATLPSASVSPTTHSTDLPVIAASSSPYLGAMTPEGTGIRQAPANPFPWACAGAVLSALAASAATLSLVRRARHNRGGQP